MTEGRADICFLAVEPAREAQVAFTAPYVVIEGVFVVPEDSPTRHACATSTGPACGSASSAGSAYDLFLTRTLEHADRRTRE